MAQRVWSDSHEFAPVGGKREDTVTRASERCLPPLKGVLRPPAGLDSLHRSFQACLFASTFSWWGILQDFLPHPILWPTYLHSFQFWTDIINGNKSFPAYKFNTETAEIVSWWQKEETSPYNLPCKQSAPSITAFSHANLGGNLIYDLNWASLGKHVTSELGFRNFYLHSS